MTALMGFLVAVAVNAGVAVVVRWRVCWRDRQGARARARREVPGGSRVSVPAGSGEDGVAVRVQSPVRAGLRFPDRLSAGRVRGCARRLLFRAVYYGFLPFGHAQVWLARSYRRAGVGVGWPLLVVWWPLRRLYAFGYWLCWALRP
jgi:hypothetical protein